MTHPVVVANTNLSFIVDEQQARIEREEKAKEKAKEKAMIASRAKLINEKGDDLMYGPAESYIPPTLTGGKWDDLISSPCSCFY